MRRIATIVGILALAASVEAAPPPLASPDVATLHGLCEASRNAQRAMVPPVQPTLKIHTIVIDPGHGGENSGALGVANVHEKVLTLDLAFELRDAIEAKFPEVRVLLTRYWDRAVGLNERTNWANAVGGDLFLSLHYNAATHDRALGYETYFLADETMAATAERGSRRKQEASKPQRGTFKKVDRARVQAHKAARAVLQPPHERSKLLAEVVQGNLKKHLDGVNRGVKQANFAVLRGARMPAVVIESGFLTHPEEGQTVLHSKHREAVIVSLLEAIEAFDKAPVDTKPPPPVAQRSP